VTLGKDGHKALWVVYRHSETGKEYYVVGDMRKRYLEDRDYKPASKAAVNKLRKEEKQERKERTELWKAEYSTGKYVTLHDEGHEIKHLLYHVPNSRLHYSYYVLEDEKNDVWKMAHERQMKYVEAEYNGEVIIMRGTKTIYHVIESPDGNKYVYDQEMDESTYLTDPKLKGKFTFQKKNAKK
jgi:hypothetical protein